jgi:hypothetical protein
MDTYFFEATNGFNHGKFAVAFFDDEEWERRSALPSVHGGRLLSALGWGRSARDLHMWVLDLQTGEGMYVPVEGSADYQLDGLHQIRVCPLFLPFLRWLYGQDLTRLAELSGTLVRLTEEEAPSSMASRRSPAWAREAAAAKTVLHIADPAGTDVRIIGWDEVT